LPTLYSGGGLLQKVSTPSLERLERFLVESA